VRTCLGARFRLHGRTIECGLDCLGVVAIAYGLRDVPAGYALRGGRPGDLIARIEARGFTADVPAPARLLLLAAGPFQHHLAVTTARGFIHADAGLRRVVETPGAPRWPLLGCWRAPTTRD
jgi:lipoprotein Spr